MFIAVVYKNHADTYPDSHKAHGAWESFMDYEKDAAVQKAMTWAARWTVTSSIDENDKVKYSGPYRILVGEVKEEVAVPIEYKKFDGHME